MLWGREGISCKAQRCNRLALERGYHTCAWLGVCETHWPLQLHQGAGGVGGNRGPAPGGV